VRSQLCLSLTATGGMAPARPDANFRYQLLILFDTCMPSTPFSNV
jgi:hypothetical protein